MKQAMLSAWYVGIGGFLGAISRYAVMMFFSQIGNKELATFLVNIIGAILLGGVMGLAQVRTIPPLLLLFFSTGFLGALTTFSTIALETMMLWNTRQIGKLGWYVGGTLTMGLLGVSWGNWLGHRLG